MVRSSQSHGDNSCSDSHSSTECRDHQGNPWIHTSALVAIVDRVFFLVLDFGSQYSLFHPTSSCNSSLQNGMYMIVWITEKCRVSTFPSYSITLRSLYYTNFQLCLLPVAWNCIWDIFSDNWTVFCWRFWLWNQLPNHVKSCKTVIDCLKRLLRNSLWFHMWSRTLL